MTYDYDTRPDAKPLVPAFRIASSVKTEKQRFLWSPWVPIGTTTIITGNGGLGKSGIALDLAARLSVGRPAPDNTPLEAEGKQGVAIIAGEDGMSGIVSRLRTCGADADRIMCMSPDDDFDLTNHKVMREFYSGIIKYSSKLGMLIIDPIKQYMRTDNNSESCVRPALSALTRLAEEARIALVLIAHPSKHNMKGGRGWDDGEVGGAGIGIGGSIAYYNVARSVTSVQIIPNESSDKIRTCLMKQEKSNYAQVSVPMRYRVGGNGAIEWLGYIDKMSEDIISSDGTETADARDFLINELAHGYKKVKWLVIEGRAHGFMPSTLRRARAKLGYSTQTYRKGGKNITIWFNPNVVQRPKELSDGDWMGE